MRPEAGPGEWASWGVSPSSVAASGGRLPPIALTTNCPSCGVGLVPEALRERCYVCDCGHHFRMHADAWIALLADAGSWQERWADIRPHDLLEWKVPRAYQETLDQARAEGLNEAVRVGTATLAGLAVWLAVFDFRFVGGSLSIVAGERLTRSLEQAAATRTPYLLLAASGGARMQEGILALMQMAKINGAVGRLHQMGVPYFAVLTDPTYGGVPASLALLADVNIAEPGAAIGFTGPRVIKQSTHADLPPGFQSAEFQLRCGQVDLVVPRTELRARLAHLIRLYTRPGRGRG
jgi:acetyl-CoA carboxylase carboxyl transferase subunit beta